MFTAVSLSVGCATASTPSRTLWDFASFSYNTTRPAAFVLENHQHKPSFSYGTYSGMSSSKDDAASCCFPNADTTGEDDAAIYCGGSVDDEWNWANASHGARVNCEFTRTCAGYLSDYYNSTSEYFTSKEETCPTSFNQCTEWRHTIETCDTDLEKGNTTSTYTTDDTTGDLVKMSFETSSDHGGYCFDSATFITTNFFDQKAWDVTMVCELLSAHNVLASTVALCEQVMSLH